ncbi:MAG: nucleotidyltransferase domain-containing protein [Candidatus Pacearchaeota archaeon]
MKITNHMENRGIFSIIEKAKKDKQVIAVALFGSSLKGVGRDVDICIFLDKKYPNLEMSKKKLNFLKEINNRFDIQIFQQLPIYIRVRILKEMRILFCRNKDLLYEIAFSTIKEFNLFEKRYNFYLEAIKNGKKIQT